MKAFRVKGTAPFGQQRQAFSMDLPAADAGDAEHRVYSIMGSRHNVTRRSIHLDSVAEIDPRISQEPSVLHHFREAIAAEGGRLSPSEEE
jgi:ribosomal protein L20A (L18A)